MPISRFVVLATFVGLTASVPAYSQGAARDAGRAVGEFGAGVGEVVGEGVMKGATGSQAEWVTVKPRSKDECMTESGGVVDPTFMRCRNGYQEYVQVGRDGRRKVLRERPIPTR
ncbi:MAG: hypothetical protein K0Q76_2190 [Panacagrimonas sp.]|jgi:hypothetical protein|nr:hypothetical protein [Panacagrimonas sp.]